MGGSRSNSGSDRRRTWKHGNQSRLILPATMIGATAEFGLFFIDFAH
jgi:hypothetical protein